jgi:hypothetical protein
VRVFFESRISMHRGVDWNAAPKNAMWWAADADGKAHWFNAPNVVPFTGFWFADQETAPLFGYEGDWRQSLTKRPG